MYNRIKAVLAENNKTNNWLADQLGVRGNGVEFGLHEVWSKTEGII